MNRHRSTALAVLVATGTLLSACGHGGHSGASSKVVEGAREIEVGADDLSFDPAEITASVGEDLAVALTSGDVLHDFTIDELDAHVAASRGETEVGGFTATEAGTFTYYCSVAGHRSAGMEGTLTVE